MDNPVLPYMYVYYRRNGSVRRIRFDWPKSHLQNGTRDEHKHFDRIYEKQISSLLVSLSVRTVLQSECVLNTMISQFHTRCMKSKLQITNINFVILVILILSVRPIHSAGNIYIYFGSFFLLWVLFFIFYPSLDFIFIFRCMKNQDMF